MSGAAIEPGEIARQAMTLAGVPFRLHGRDPATGLDCIGLFAAACTGAGITLRVPNGYLIRSTRLPPDIAAIAASCGFRPASGAAEAGDVLMLRPGSCQFHLAIVAPGGALVHADAGLGRVVIMPGPPPWPIIHHWRLIAPSRGMSWQR